MTCAHVIRDLQEDMRRKGTGPGLAQFELPLSDGTWRSAPKTFDIHDINDDQDVATLRLGSAPGPEPLRLAAPGHRRRVGETVAICGYSHGSVLLGGKARITRCGPILQQGVIVALAPFDAEEAQNLLLDIRIGPCGSGSPIFSPSSGEVLGILTEAQAGPQAAISIARPVYMTAEGKIRLPIVVMTKAGDSPP
jgi:hypothetical protein